MKPEIKTLSILYLAMIVIGMAGCGKNFLDLKPDQTQKVPDRISDFQALMDNTGLLNFFSSHILALIGGDEYTLSDVKYDRFPAETNYLYMKRGYTWDREIFTGGEQTTDWSRGYTRVLQANIVLDGLKKVSPPAAEQSAYNQVKGSALFHRAFSFYSMAQAFCKMYDRNTANEDMGLPLRLEADVTLKTPRASVEETYQQIASDLIAAAPLLPETPKVLFRPSKSAAFALLAKLYLQMGDYSKSADYASQSLAIKNSLNNFNEKDLDARYTFPIDGAGNPEILFLCSTDNVVPLASSFIDINPDLQAAYTQNDLRKKAYFFTNTDNRILFKGSYTGASFMFTGLAVDEVLLIRAECYARLNQLSLALKDLNTLAANRYNKKTFLPFSPGTTNEAMTLIVAEKKKELLLRGTRWEDLRRWNKEPAFAQKLTRVVKGIKYELPPNDRRYVWPLPLEAIVSGGYPQNPR